MREQGSPSIVESVPMIAVTYSILSFVILFCGRFYKSLPSSPQMARHPRCHLWGVIVSVGKHGNDCPPSGLRVQVYTNFSKWANKNVKKCRKKGACPSIDQKHWIGFHRHDGFYEMISSINWPQKCAKKIKNKNMHSSIFAHFFVLKCQFRPKKLINT